MVICVKICSLPPPLVCKLHEVQGNVDTKYILVEFTYYYVLSQFGWILCSYQMLCNLFYPLSLARCLSRMLPRMLGWVKGAKFETWPPTNWPVIDITILYWYNHTIFSTTDMWDKNIRLLNGESGISSEIPLRIAQDIKMKTDVYIWQNMNLKYFIFAIYTLSLPW